MRTGDKYCFFSVFKAVLILFLHNIYLKFSIRSICVTFCLIRKCVLQLIFIRIYKYNFQGMKMAPIRWNDSFNISKFGTFNLTGRSAGFLRVYRRMTLFLLFLLLMNTLTLSAVWMHTVNPRFDSHRATVFVKVWGLVWQNPRPTLRDITNVWGRSQVAIKRAVRSSTLF